MSADPQGSTCVHCGLPLRAKTLSKRAERFCCSGCALVHGLLGRGLDRERAPGEARSGSASAWTPRWALSAFLSMGVMVCSLALYGMDEAVQGESARALQGVFRMGALLLSLPVLFLVGLPLLDALVRARAWLSADALVVTGTGAAWLVSAWNTLAERSALSSGVYFDTAAMVLVLVAVGKCLDARARERAALGLETLARENAPQARRRAPGSAPAGSEALESVDPERLVPGDRALVRPGELVPVDGEVLEGRASVDEADLTGEEVPRVVGPGDRLWAGTWVLDGALTLCVEAVRGGRLRDRIEGLLAEARGRRAPLVRLADRLAGLLLPVSLLLALTTLLLHWESWGPERALLAALSVVLIACPCALGLATPLAFWVALGEAWRRGVLVRSGDVLERLARLRAVFLDKTGTLTTGRFELVDVDVDVDVGARGALDAERALAIAALLERGSEHPIARSLCAHVERRGIATPGVLHDFRAWPGRGVSGVVDGRAYELGAPRVPEEELGLTAVHLRDARDGTVLARIRLRAALREDARAAVAELAALGLPARVLTGDGPGPARWLAQELGLPVEHGLLPTDKAERVAAAGRGTLFVGDGLNDAPAFAAADTSIAVRGASPRSLENASAGLMGERLGAIPALVRLARRAVGVARFNLLWACAYNVVGLWLAFQGRLSPVFAAGAMVASGAVIAFNASRLQSGTQGARMDDEGADRVAPDAPHSPHAHRNQAQPDPLWTGGPT